MLEHAKFDYIRFLFVLPEDEANQIWMVFKRQLTNGEYDLLKQVKLTALGVSLTNPSRRRYVMEAWGEAASYAPLLNTQWMGNLIRADVKSPALAWDEGDIDLLYQRWLAHDKVRNINRFKTRPRQKSGGRTSGGEGVALGSHKSQLRVSVYRRHGQPFRVESQVTGMRLRGLVEEAKEEWLMSPRGTSTDPWSSLLENVLGTGIDRLLRSAGLDAVTLPACIPELGENQGSDWFNGEICPTRAELDPE